MDKIIIDDKIFKRFTNEYYVSEFGEIYSKYSNKILKHSIDHNGYHRVDIYSFGKPLHIKIHKIVYLVWIGNIPKGKQINHKDDDKNNNHYSNLYAGTQEENIKDCIKNNHRVGNIYHMTIYDNKIKKTITFCPVKKFIKYCGHSCKNGNVKKYFNKYWFKKRYKLIDYGKGKV